MKASERLRELESPGMRGVWDGKRLLPVVPLIISVVEAAQTVNDDLFFDPPLNAALTALRDALQPEGDK